MGGLNKEDSAFIGIKSIECKNEDENTWSCKFYDKMKPGKHRSVREKEIENVKKLDIEDAGLNRMNWGNTQLYNKKIEPWGCIVKENEDGKHVRCKTREGEDELTESEEEDLRAELMVK